MGVAKLASEVGVDAIIVGVGCVLQAEFAEMTLEPVACGWVRSPPPSDILRAEAVLKGGRSQVLGRSPASLGLASEFGVSVIAEIES